MFDCEDHRYRTLAWTASLAVHSLLSAGVLYGGWSEGAAGGGDGPTREIGVVLRQSAAPPSPFDPPHESDADTIETADLAPVEQPRNEAATLAASPFASLLEDLVEQGAGVGAPNTGGATSPPAGGQPDLPIGKARVPFLGVEGIGTRFVYVLDRSTSMEGGPLRAVKAHLVASLDAIGPAQQFHVLFFNTQVASLDLTGGQHRIAFGVEENKRRAAKFVLAVTADGGTERKGALDSALRLRPDVIFFLTDDDTPMTERQLEEIIDDASGSATIHTIEFGKGPDHGRTNFLTELARRTGGQHAYVDTSMLPR